MDALVAFALLLFVVLAPRAIMHACCVDAGAALAALALLLLLVLALLLLSLLLLSLWLRRLQCVGLFRLPRFPFHDSQVTGSARDACISRGAFGGGVENDSSFHVEVSLGGLPPKGGV